MKYFIALIVLGILCSLSLGQKTDAPKPTEPASSKVGVFYYSFHPTDDIRCKRPPCPKYHVKRINSNEDKQLITDFTFESGVNKSHVVDAKPGTVVVYGYLISTKTLPPSTFLHVVRYYKELPHQVGSVERGSKYYSFKFSGIVCVTTPCPAYTAVELNTNNATNHFGILNSYANVTLFDNEWFNARIYDKEEHRLVATGYYTKEGYFQIESAFVHIPDPLTKCQPPAVAVCKPPNQVRIYTRDSNRCYVSDGCTESGACILSIPTCQPGYRLVGHPAGKFGCPAYYCDYEYLDVIPSPNK
ncbi:hypothetical protein DLAC_08079 [Tieghemostelium lacteum]|uniref:DUF6748 domain-containing protein n=1 Tax=Tieghemostelium lacteum TaxID=361077 RepID=A0A151ZB57_TIELA|nr:hypothetical protein DLAC_08079 [Tieghemostelium lacteum]|eukprot:KYQ91168.1 hypothetical protein DLAC_08079 [Tieghemostelium lacteum]